VVLVGGVPPVGGVDGELAGPVTGFAVAVASIRDSLAVGAGAPLGCARAGLLVAGLLAGAVAVAGALGGEEVGTGPSASLRLGLAWLVTPSMVTVVSTDQPLPAYE
jgi:hypothetical protein